MDWNGFESLQEYVADRVEEFDLIPKERREILERLAAVISDSKEASINIIFICTHNSRRSHMAHLWASLGAEVYGAKKVYCFSGGTEVTAFNPMAVKAIKKAGFRVSTRIPGANPVYLVSHPGCLEGVKVFSKKGVLENELRIKATPDWTKQRNRQKSLNITFQVRAFRI